jgi:alpha-1,3-glucan synthase
LILFLTLVRSFLASTEVEYSSSFADPSDIAALDEQPVDMANIGIDTVAEAQRPEHKRQAQEWANIKQDPTADLFVFVGRWSKQKGVDVIADVMPSL